MSSDPSTLVLGAVADDFTGATDLAGLLSAQGMRVALQIGTPPPHNINCEFSPEAIVVALKTRSVAPAEAVERSLAAARWLRAQGAGQLFFKYCSTFDSTPEGNIGPVAESLFDLTESEMTVACPAYPANGRTVYQGHLFVRDRLLSESGMERHPLTPMTDPNLVRWLGRQTSLPIGLVPLQVVQNGPEAVIRQLARLRKEGIRIAVLDAVCEADLETLAVACADLPLLTGGSGLALGLPEVFRRHGVIAGEPGSTVLPDVRGPAAVIAGSCSTATLAQVASFAADHPHYVIDAERVASGDPLAQEALDWAASRIGEKPVLISSSATASVLDDLQTRLGREAIGGQVEHVLATIAGGLIARGVRRLIVAGGETSGAVVSALGISTLRVGPEICPGVPWCETQGDPRLAIALKSGNFGDERFFSEALEMLS